MNIVERMQKTFNALTKTAVGGSYTCSGFQNCNLCSDPPSREYGCLTCQAAREIISDVSGVQNTGPYFHIIGEVKVVRKPNQIVDVRLSNLN